MSRRSASHDEISMIPMMNLVTILIPFMLAAASFVDVGVVDVALPARGPAADEVGPVPKLVVARGALAVFLDGGLEASVPCACGSYDDVDAAALDGALGALALPATTTLVLGIGDDVPYDVVIAAMDAARPRFPSVAIAGM